VTARALYRKKATSNLRRDVRSATAITATGGHRGSSHGTTNTLQGFLPGGVREIVNEDGATLPGEARRVGQDRRGCSGDYGSWLGEDKGLKRTLNEMEQRVAGQAEALQQGEWERSRVAAELEKERTRVTGTDGADTYPRRGTKTPTGRRRQPAHMRRQPQRSRHQRCAR